jgi:hypothetical protein
LPQKYFLTRFQFFFLFCACGPTANEGKMKITAIATVTVITAMAARAGETTRAAEQVIVCIEDSASSGFLHAQAIASRIFAAIGVSIRWRRRLKGCPPQGIQISLISGAPRNAKPSADALAYALPYEGVHINVLYDRIAQGTSTLLLPQLLAHVLVHEITHILQGFTQHSAQGMMKAHWNRDDFENMLGKPLQFSSDDVRWIHRGLEARIAPSKQGEKPVEVCSY